MSDDKGSFGLLIAHSGSHVHYTIQIESREELVAAIESFQQNPVGTLVWYNISMNKKELI